jgi:hypothetical protein
MNRIALHTLRRVLAVTVALAWIPTTDEALTRI